MCKFCVVVLLILKFQEIDIEEKAKDEDLSKKILAVSKFWTGLEDKTVLK